MTGLEDLLSRVEALIRDVRVGEADEIIRQALRDLDETDLRLWEPDLRQTIACFLPKRRRALTDVLDHRLGRVPPRPPPAAHADPDAVAIAALSARLADDLANLSNYHIFQWSTFYRDSLARWFDHLLALGVGVSSPILDTVVDGLSDHTHDIFTKGFAYISGQVGTTPQYAITKSANGLQRFVDLPIELYSTRLPTTRRQSARLELRALTSAMLAGILQGYARVTFGRQTGGQLLPRYPRSWGHVVPFLTASQLSILADRLSPGVFRDGLVMSVAPLLRALDAMAAAEPDYFPLPALAQFRWESRRLDISLQPPLSAAEPKFVDLQAYLDATLVDRGALDEAAARDVGLVVAPLRPDLQAVVSHDDRMRRVTVSPTGDLQMDGAAITSLLSETLFRRVSPRYRRQPLQYNFARQFPLRSPFLSRYFHVDRSSVRDLAHAFERRTGVRLWCSVRRSGKTTACFDLGPTELSMVISQTCDDTGQIPDGNVLYDTIVAALSSRERLPKTFFADTVLQCASADVSPDARLVLVVDEYETLFGVLSTEAAADATCRYRVVQPLLNQMVAFSRDHLLVFLGQDPDAHFILMDQNQLSAYVEQESFPLFYHRQATTDGEFAEFVRRVFADQVTFDAGFLDALFAETAGHPFLTANCLVEFVDWLIETKRPVAALDVDEGDFAAFAAAKLTQARLSVSPEYSFFRSAVGQAVGAAGRRDTPWLHAVYSTMRNLCRAAPDAFSCSRADFSTIAATQQVDALGFGADGILRTGAQANFFTFDDESVRPRIRLLGRIAQAQPGEVLP
jgi:hypothetical protein